MILQKNILHYYVDLLRIQEGAKRPLHSSNFCINALHNIIRTMKLTRHEMICGENFRYLDFGNIPINGIFWSENGDNPACFSNSIFHEWNFTSGHSKDITVITWSPNNRYLLTGAKDNNIILWDAENGLMIRKFEGHKGAIVSLVFSKDSKTFISSSKDKTIKTWSIYSSQHRKSINISYHIKNATWDNNGDFLCTSVVTKKYYPIPENEELWLVNTFLIQRILDSKTGKTKEEILCRKIKDSALLLDSTFLNIINSSYYFRPGRTVTVYQIGSGADLLQLKDPYRNFISKIAITQNGRFIISEGHGFNGKTQSIAFWDCNTGKCCCSRIEKKKNITAIGISDDAKYCAIATNEQQIEVLHCNSFFPNVGVQGYNPQIDEKTKIRIDGNLVLCYNKTFVYVFDLCSMKKLMTISAGQKDIQSAQFMDNKDYCVVKSLVRNDKEAETYFNIFSISKNKEIITRCFCRDSLQAILTISGEMYCVIKTDNGNYEYINILTGEPNHSYKGDLYKCKISSYKSFLAVGMDNGVIDVYNAKNFEHLVALGQISSYIKSINFSVDGKYCIVYANDDKVNVYDTSNWHCISLSDCIFFKIMKGDRYALVQSRVDLKYKLQVWDMKTHSPLYTLEQHDMFEAMFGKLFSETDGEYLDVKNVFFSCETSRILVSYEKNRFKLWTLNGNLLNEIDISSILPDNKDGTMAFPYYIVVDNNIVRLYEFKDIFSPDGLKLVLIGKYYLLENAHFEHCSFLHSIVDETTRKILYQYGAEI